MEFHAFEHETCLGRTDCLKAVRLPNQAGIGLRAPGIGSFLFFTFMQDLFLYAFLCMFSRLEAFRITFRLLASFFQPE
jgi:hypothetical protein